MFFYSDLVCIFDSHASIENAAAAALDVLVLVFFCVLNNTLERIAVAFRDTQTP